MKIQTRQAISDREVRTYDVFGQFGVVTREDGKSKTIVGHAAVFDTVAGPSWFRERIEKGAFVDTVKADDIRALFNHNPDYVLGRNKAGTLTLREDDEGLWMEIEPPDTQVARDLLTSIQRGDITQASFGFVTLDDAFEKVDGDDVRVLKRVRLYDVSPVTYPFYEATDVSLRYEQWKKENDQQTVDTTKTINRRRLQMQMRQHS